MTASNPTIFSAFQSALEGMKRDMDLIRLLLLSFESDGNEVDLGDCTQEQSGFHAALLVEAGLLRGDVKTDRGGAPIAAGVIGLTWEGYEYLDSMPNESVWNHVKERASQGGLALSFSMAKTLLTEAIKEKLNLK